MIIIPEFQDEALNLRAYSYQDSEIQVLRDYLSHKEIQNVSRRLPNDRDNRIGFSFLIEGMRYVSRFSESLGIRFGRQNGQTSVDFDQAQGNPYRCIRLEHLPWKKGCEEITAADGHAAFIKCSMLANERNWFGAESEPGYCYDH